MNDRSELLVEVTRGNLVECVHRGSLAVVDRAGNLRAYAGDPELVTFMRSAAKPLQALLLVESGAADSFGLTDAELAVTCGSHSGQQEHVDAVLSLLAKAGVDPKWLDCGIHPPLDSAARKSLYRSGDKPWEIHCNCSGKHAGMLAVCSHLGLPFEDYRKPEHPLQGMIRDVVADVAFLDAEEVVLAPDGCGVVVHGLPIMNMAYAFARLATAEGFSSERRESASRIRSAMRSNSLLVAGTGRICTAINGLNSQRFVAKSGAAGVYCLGDSREGFGIAVKVDDGNGRAAGMAAVEAARQLLLLDPEEEMILEEFRSVQNTNLVREDVGHIEPTFALRKGRITKGGSNCS
ncbi:MAG: asparaginase [Clostridia bacterium]